MLKFEVEVNEQMAQLIKSAANHRQMSVSLFIAEILSRFVISPHILNNEDLKRGYEESGEVNIEWANL